jgi:hypothetical protein
LHPSFFFSGGATTTIVVGGTITAGVVTDGTTMIVAEADKEASVAGMMIGGIRCGVICAQNDGPLEKRYTGLLREFSSVSFSFCFPFPFSLPT